jgi:hypothetical protein
MHFCFQTIGAKFNKNIVVRHFHGYIYFINPGTLMMLNSKLLKKSPH